MTRPEVASADVARHLSSDLERPRALCSSLRRCLGEAFIGNVGAVSCMHKIQLLTLLCLTSSLHRLIKRKRYTAVPAEGNGALQTLICVPVARPRQCPTLSNPVESCPLTKLNGGLSQLHSVDEDAVLCLTSYGSRHAYEKKKKRSSKTKISNETNINKLRCSRCLVSQRAMTHNAHRVIQHDPYQSRTVQEQKF